MNSTALPTADRLLSLAEVSHITGLGTSAIYSRIAKGDFPEPLRVSSRCSRWRESEIVGWVNALPRGVGPQPASAAA